MCSAFWRTTEIGAVYQKTLMLLRADDRRVAAVRCVLSDDRQLDCYTKVIMMANNLLTKKQFRQLICEVEDFMSEYCGEESTIDDFLLGYTESEYRVEGTHLYQKVSLLKDLLSANSDSFDDAEPETFNAFLALFTT